MSVEITPRADRTPAPPAAARAGASERASPVRQQLRGMSYADGSALLAPVQCSTGTPGGSASGGTDLEDALAELDQALARQPDPGVFEAITASTGADGAYAEVAADAMAARWTHQTLGYVDAAREQADADTTTSSEAYDGLELLTAPEGPSNPTSSASLPRTAAPARSWGLIVTCADYVGTRGDIPAFDAAAAANRAGAEASAGGFDRARAIDNPTGAELLAAIDGDVAALAAALAPGQTGELTVGIAGHGAAGAVILADRAYVSYETLQARARQARASGVRLVFVIDACLSGEMVQRAHEEGTLDLLMQSAGSSPQQREARELLDPCLRLEGPMRAVNRQGGQVRLAGRAHARAADPDSYRELIDAIRGMQDGLSDVERILQSVALPPAEAASLPAVLEAVTEANLSSILAYDASISGVRRSARRTAAAIDAVNGLVSRLLERAQATLRRQP